MLVAYDKQTGRITQTVNDPVHPGHKENWTESGFDFIEVKRDAFVFDGTRLSIAEVKVKRGKIVPLTEAEKLPTEAEKEAVRLMRLADKRARQQPMPIHAMKLMAALNVPELLAEEAKVRGVTTAELAELIIQKAGESLAADAQILAEKK